MMRNFLRSVLVGVLLLGLSSMAGAEGWIRYDLAEGVALSVEIPSDFVGETKHSEETGDFSYGFSDEATKLGVVVVKKALGKGVPEDFKGDFPLDRLSESGRKDFLTGAFKGALNARFVTLPIGHQVVMNDMARDKFTGKVMTLVSKNYYIAVIVTKEGTLSLEEEKLAERVFSSLEL